MSGREWRAQGPEAAGPRSVRAGRQSSRSAPGRGARRRRPAAARPRPYRQSLFPTAAWRGPTTRRTRGGSLGLCARCVSSARRALTRLRGFQNALGAERTPRKVAVSASLRRRWPLLLCGPFLLLGREKTVGALRERSSYASRTRSCTDNPTLRPSSHVGPPCPPPPHCFFYATGVVASSLFSRELHWRLSPPTVRDAAPSSLCSRQKSGASSPRRPWVRRSSGARGGAGGLVLP